MHNVEEISTEIMLDSCKAKPGMFQIIGTLGQGAFGKVFMVVQKDTGQIFAMKIMKISKILARSHELYINSECEILKSIIHPFIVRMHHAFQTSRKLYLIFDFASGGQLFLHLTREGLLDESTVKIYAAEIVLAVSFLHERGIIHRDLKPENILLHGSGHICISDFGLAKQNIGNSSCETNSFCGTIEYMAPEIISSAGHGKAADWWSVGVLLFEMMTGRPPYTGHSRMRIQERILKERLKVPSYLSSEAASLIKLLLTKDAKNRLGSGPRGPQNVKDHKFFSGVNWDKVLNLEVTPSFQPKAENGILDSPECCRTSTMDEDSPSSSPLNFDPELFNHYIKI